MELFNDGPENATKKAKNQIIAKGFPESAFVNVALVVYNITELEYNLYLSNWFFIGYWIITGLHFYAALFYAYIFHIESISKKQLIPYTLDFSFFSQP